MRVLLGYGVTSVTELVTAFVAVVYPAYNSSYSCQHNAKFNYCLPHGEPHSTHAIVNMNTITQVHR